ncbi:MAG: hypothetical protein QF535_23215, partial [Anaerolineales bacterium]|nr:hypothetical protein [Anaerolineales bacterium]
IADDAIDSEHYAAASIDNEHLADNAVDTAEIADNAVTLAKMAGLARGKLIYGDASGDPAALAVGSADEVLTHDGTDFGWAAAGGGIDCDADAWARIAPMTDQASAAVIDWATSVHLGSNITESGGVITVGTAGWYLVTFHITNASNQSRNMSMQLRKNGTAEFGRTYWENCTIKYMGIESTVIVECDAADTLDVYGSGYYSGDTVVATSTTWFTGVRLGA